MKTLENNNVSASTENTIATGLIQSALEATDLNWSVSTQPIQTASGIIIPNKVAIVRDDIQAILGIHSDGYHPFQNEKLMETVYKISQQTGLQIHKSGLFGVGEKAYIQLKNETFKLGDCDTIETYFTAVNSFDGSTQFGFGTTEITISCRNTFMGAYRNLDSKMKHTASMQIKLDGILRQIDVMRQEEKDNMKTIEKMANVTMDEETKLLVTKLLFDIPLTDKVSFNELTDNKNKVISTRKQNQIIQFENDLRKETNQKGENMWGLFSGMTRFTTHSWGGDKKDSTENKMFGSLGERERKVFNKLAALV